MTYHRGTFAEFNTWHNAAMLAEGITEEGRVGFINGIPAPDSQRTTAYSESYLHPTNEDDYVWTYGSHIDVEKTSSSQSEVEALGWFPAEV